MTDAIEINLIGDADLFAECRRLVESGVGDVPVTVYRDGMHTVSLASLHRAACRVVVENPSIHLAPYKPHYRAPIGPRLAAVLEADRSAREDRRKRRILASVEGGGT